MKNAAIDLSVWERRWRSLDDTLAHWLEPAANRTPVQRQETLDCLVAGLQAFGKSQMQFFLRGLAPQPQYRLEPSAEYPWEYVFRTIVDQIGYDLDVLQRAQQQRMAPLMPPAALATLDLADRLAFRALKPAFDHGLIDQDTTVVTYFQKAANVRLVPYAPVALVGVPLTAIDHERDLLAIPHEVGHYLFRSGRVRAGRFADSRFSAVLYHRYARKPVWFNHWLEEIFADVYGCLVAGPVVALSFMELVTDDPLDDFLANDNEHPAAIVRPAVYFSTLKRMGIYDKALTQLTDHWQALVKERGNPREMKLPGADQPVAVSQVIDDLDQVVETLLHGPFLGKLLPQRNGEARKLWSQELHNKEEVKSLYDHFAQFKGEITPTSTPLTELRREPAAQLQMATALPQAAESPGRVQSLGATGLWLDAIKAAAERTVQDKDPTFAVPPEVWLVLLDAGGWATEGPGGGNPHR
jgi:hypothetical protein